MMQIKRLFGERWGDKRRKSEYVGTCTMMHATLFPLIYYFILVKRGRANGYFAICIHHLDVYDVCVG